MSESKTTQMADTAKNKTYKDAKDQLDEIVAQVRKKDVSLEKSLDLLEEGVALANRCTELIDQAAWETDVDESLDSEDFEADESAIDDKSAHSDLAEIDLDEVGEFDLRAEENAADVESGPEASAANQVVQEQP